MKESAPTHDGHRPGAAAGRPFRCRRLRHVRSGQWRPGRSTSRIYSIRKVRCIPADDGHSILRQRSQDRTQSTKMRMSSESTRRRRGVNHDSIGNDVRADRDRTPLAVSARRRGREVRPMNTRFEQVFHCDFRHSISLKLNGLYHRLHRLVSGTRRPPPI